MKQLFQFDLKQGEFEKLKGMKLAACARSQFVSMARLLARQIARNRKDRTVSIDDIQKILLSQGIELKMAAGSVFGNRRDWEHVGYKKTVRVSSHAREVKLWRLKPGR